MPLTHELLSLDNGLGRAQRQHGGRIASSARRSAGGADFCGLLANLLDNALEHPPAGLGEPVFVIRSSPTPRLGRFDAVALRLRGRGRGRSTFDRSVFRLVTSIRSEMARGVTAGAELTKLRCVVLSRFGLGP